jgi:hypothetical protein
MSLTTADIPQADLLWDVARVPEAIVRGWDTPEAIGEYIGAKVSRQGLYYTQAARILGMVLPCVSGTASKLTPFGRAFANYNRVEQRTALRRILLYREPTRSVVLALRSQDGLDRMGVARALQGLAPLADSTAYRRAFTITAWLCDVGLAERRGNRIFYSGPALPLPSAPDQASRPSAA